MATARGAIYEFEYLASQQCTQILIKGRAAGLITNDFHLQALIADSLIRGVKAETDFDPLTNVIAAVRTLSDAGMPYSLRPREYRVLWTRFTGPPSDQITEAILEDANSRRLKVRARGTSAFAVLATAMKTEEWLESVELDVSHRFLLRGKIVRRGGKTVRQKLATGKTKPSVKKRIPKKPVMRAPKAKPIAKAAKRKRTMAKQSKKPMRTKTAKSQKRSSRFK